MQPPSPLQFGMVMRLNPLAYTHVESTSSLHTIKSASAKSERGEKGNGCLNEMSISLTQDLARLMI